MLTSSAGGGWEPTDIYEAGLRSATGGLWAHHPDGRRIPLPVDRWRGTPATAAGLGLGLGIGSGMSSAQAGTALSAGDLSLLGHCAGPTLDVGCGPGRLVAALAARGIPALGIDVAPLAVRLTRQTGAVALRRDVFGRVPAEGRWAALLLADGNIGIGGDPVRLLRRARQLLAPTGHALVEVDPPGAPAGSVRLRLEDAAGRVSKPFAWCLVGVDQLAAVAPAAGLLVARSWQSTGRHFVALRRKDLRRGLMPSG
ncbi:class I SAM-dependent methyltransferase [Candidatus Frankia alpina]|uniref:class I SAM-dependent methyltransferase n=1 Tax=Candidatus Frankia alpina TaxID=2699483 RepID=UPI0013D49354|nr:class I SAM-dependent methyltransferase [Candidatus Frankia alpina]